MSDPVTDEIMGRVVKIVRTEMEGGMRDAAEGLRGLIAVPVVREKGKVIRSAPGEPPRKDSGKLQASVASTVEVVAGDKIRGVVSTSTPYDKFLNEGTSRMAARPFQMILEERWEQLIENRLDFAVRQAPPQT
jgi:hypothetical protein